MPIPAAVLIPAAADVLSQGLNAFSQGKMNRKTRRWNEKMYAKQRADALADFYMQNEYNSPTSQMARLREAGLNPNLVYGDGNAIVNSANVRSSDTGQWNPRPPQFDLGRAGSMGLASYYDTQIKQATLDNLKEQNTVIKQEGFLKAAETANLGQQTATGAYNLEFEQSLRDINAQARKLALDKTTVEMDVLLDRNHREAAMQAVTIQQAVKNMLKVDADIAKTYAERKHILQQIENLQQDFRIKKLDEELSKAGISRSDPFWLRTATVQYQRSKLPSSSIKGGLGSGIKQYFDNNKK